MIRFDEDNRTLSLSVRDLADDLDYRFSGPSPVSLKRRALLGRLAHEDHQGAREDAIDSYRRERSVRYETRIEGWRVVVSGRIDGIYTDEAGQTVIEEVKTIVGTEAELLAACEETFPHYARQLQLYRYLLEEGAAGLSFSADVPEIALHLFLIALPGRATRTLTLGYERERCRELVERRLAEIVSDRGAAQAEAERRRAARARIVFPHDAARPQQEDMIAAIEAALSESGQALVSAPPGVGKTAAALVPALRRACELGGRVFVATSKTTQQELFAETVRAMAARGAPVRAVVLTAREKACLNEVVHCHPDACAYAADYAQKLQGSGALERLRALPVADLGAIAAEARAHAFCPFEAALDLSDVTDVVIGDYNYAFDPGAALKRLFVERAPSDVVLVVDEAHNLYERAMGYYSPTLRRDGLRRLDQALVGGAHPLERRARGLLQRLIAYLERLARGEAPGPATPAPRPEPAPQPPGNLLLFGDAEEPAPRRRRQPQPSLGYAAGAPSAAPTPPPLAPPPSRPLPPEREVEVDVAFLGALRDELAELAVAWFAEGRARAGEDLDPLVAASRLLSRFVGVLELAGEEFSLLWREDDGGELKVLCKDPSRQLARRLEACGGVVCVSATLEPLEFYRDVLGLRPDALVRAFPSPFDPRRRKVIVLDLPSTAYRARERDLPIVCDAVRAVVAARPGNYLVCCPSFRYLGALADRIFELPGFHSIRQERGMSDEARAAVLARLREGPARGDPPVVLFAVQGGVFTEGVDYSGEACVGAIVVGPGLPSVNFERGLIQDYYQRRYGRGFEYAFLYPGMSKVIQSAGRVIRTPTDRGVVALVGMRFATPRYSSLFPRDWYRDHPRELICPDPYGELRAFWAEEG
ncbi:MAG: helicase C-terminal domain-containing protein [Planctomycetota bacterium]